MPVVDPSEETRPRPVVAAATAVLGLALAAASLTGSQLVVAAVLAVGSLVVSAGLPRLAGVHERAASGGVLALTSVGVGAALAARGEEPYLELVPVAAGAGIVLTCLVPLVRTRARAELTPWLATTLCGVGLLLCGAGYAAAVAAERAPLRVAGVALAVSALVDLAPQHPRRQVWGLAGAMLVGGVAGLSTELVTSGGAHLWAFLVGLLAAVVAVSLRRVLAHQRGIEHPVGALAAGAGSVLLAGPVVLVLGRAFLG